MSSDHRAGRRFPRDRTRSNSTAASRSTVDDLDDLAGDTVATAVAMVRSPHLSLEQTRAATQALAEITDAVALISDHLARQLYAAPGEHRTRSPDAAHRAIEELYGLRATLTAASSRARALHRTLDHEVTPSTGRADPAH